MNTVRLIKTIIILFALLMGVMSEAWAQESPTLTKANIIIDGGTQVGETDEYTVTNGSVTITSVSPETRTVTLTVTPSAGYCIQKSDIVVQKLADPAVAGAPRRVPDLADPLIGVTWLRGQRSNPVRGGHLSSVAARGSPTFCLPHNDCRHC